MSINLAPQHKNGLIVANPILLAAGVVGYGEVIPRGLDLGIVGAAVVGPVMSSSRGGSRPPRLAHGEGYIVLDSGLQNRGSGPVLQRFARLWPDLGCPIVVQLADSQPSALVKVAVRLAELEGVAGWELLLPSDADPAHAAALTRAAVRGGDVPVWVKLPLARAAGLASICVQEGAAGLVMGQPPVGLGLRSTAPGATQPVRGQVFGPATFPSMLQALDAVAALALPAAIIACGGIHTGDQVRQALAAGAQAVQIDSVLWVEPGAAARLVRETMKGS